MATLIVGASGATGKKLVEHLLNRKQRVKIIVRTPEKLPESWKTNDQLVIIKNSVLNISEEEMAKHLEDCDAVASCLGHNLTWKGVYGKPRKLVRDSVMLLCNAIKKNDAKLKHIKVVLMNTTGNRNADLNEKISFAQKIVIALLRLLLPPHVDNEKAADFLRTDIGQNDRFIEWTAVRPDGLINDDTVSEYDIYPSPTRSAIFDAGKISRINVAHFMAELITDNTLWEKWKGQMPVIYNRESNKKSN